MGLAADFDRDNLADMGRRLHAFAAELYPLCRSITGNGVRQTLKRIGQVVPLQTFELPSGTSAFDWTIPKEWNIRDAYIKDLAGNRVVDFRKCNLHVLNYSVPVKAVMPFSELKPHLFTIPDHPEWVPYRTSYYKENWGFCLSHSQMQSMQDELYEVCIDTSLENGAMTYGEIYVPGRTADEVLISCHVCHPSLANDNLSGLTVATFLAGLLGGRKLRYSYRLLFVPGTIGAIAWLARNPGCVQRVRHGWVLTCVGDSGGFHYKKSRRGDAGVDRAVAHVLRHCGEPAEVLEFSPYGYDERQYCSPGFNLPVGCLMRSVWGQFPEYHTSEDNLEFIRPDKLAGTLRVCASVVDVLEGNRRYLNMNPFCEPQLGKRGLYRTTGGSEIAVDNLAMLWVLNLSDGHNSLLDIAERAGIPFSRIRGAADHLEDHGLISEVTTNEATRGTV